MNFMAETVTTVADAAHSPTPPGPLTQRQAEPTRYDGSPRPGFIEDRDYDALPDDRKAAYARVKRAGDQGGAEWIERAKLEAEPADPAKPGTPVDPNAKHKLGSYEFTETEIADLLKFKGETELRKAAVPGDPSGYKIEMPADTVMPPGFEWKFNEADPALAVARNWAHKNGLTQPQFAELLGQYAAMEAGKEAQFRNSMKGEVDKLGVNGPVRITALQTWLRGTIGDDLTKSLTAGLFSERQVSALEKLALKFANQGVASFRQDGREQQTRGYSEEEWAAMSQSERYSIAKEVSARKRGEAR
jgi:hypothetical protein